MAIGYDPLDPAQVDDHQSVLSRLRREAPVSELKPGFFYLARYQDVMDVCRAPQVFRQGRHIPRKSFRVWPTPLHVGQAR